VSRYVPPRVEAMPTHAAFSIFMEKNPRLRCAQVLGHWLFGYIHPYPDATAYAVLNESYLASGGFIPGQ